MDVGAPAAGVGGLQDRLTVHPALCCCRDRDTETQRLACQLLSASSMQMGSLVMVLAVLQACGFAVLHHQHDVSGLASEHQPCCCDRRFNARLRPTVQTTRLQL